MFSNRTIPRKLSNWKFELYNHYCEINDNSCEARNLSETFQNASKTFLLFQERFETTLKGYVLYVVDIWSGWTSRKSPVITGRERTTDFIHLQPSNELNLWKMKKKLIQIKSDSINFTPTSPGFLPVQKKKIMIRTRWVKVTNKPPFIQKSSITIQINF